VGRNNKGIRRPMPNPRAEARGRDYNGSNFQLFFYLKIEIDAPVPWRVEILNETIAAEIASFRPACRRGFFGLRSASLR
jgi:hypothetical protein